MLNIQHKGLVWVLSAAAFALAACTTSQVTDEGRDLYYAMDVNEVMGQVTPSNLQSTFREVCDDNISDFRKAAALAKSRGYFLVATDKDLTIFATHDGLPWIAFGGDDLNNPDLCMVLYPDAPDLAQVMPSYAQRNGATIFDIPLPLPGAVRIWERPTAQPPRIYVEVVQNGLTTGPVRGFGVGEI